MYKKVIGYLFIPFLFATAFYGLFGNQKIQFKEEIIRGRKYTHMFVNGENVGFLSRVETEGLQKKHADLKKLFTSEKSIASDNLTLRKFKTNLFDALEFMFSKHGVGSFAMLGNLYIKPKFRGNGYAKKVIWHVCDVLSKNKKNKYIALFAGPYEREGSCDKVILETDPEYNKKKSGLIKLYKSCGFIESGFNGFMLQKVN